MIDHVNHYKKSLKALLLNIEKFITFGFGKIRFIDSLSFMGSSLANLTENLKSKGTDKFKNLNSYFKDYPEDDLELLRQKGLYPYSWVNGDPRKFEQTYLPPKSAFYDTLKEESVSEQDYLRAQLVWRKFNCKTFKDYHELYLMTDTLLLADIFEEFRNLCLENYHLDPCWFVSAPGLSEGAFLLNISGKYS